MFHTKAWGLICPISIQESKKIYLPKESNITSYSERPSKAQSCITSQLKEKYEEVSHTFLRKTGDLAKLLSCNDQQTVSLQSRFGVLNLRWIWLCSIFEYLVLFSGLMWVRPFFPLMSNRWLKRPICTSDVGGTVQEQFIPARLWVTTLPRSRRPLLIKEVLATHWLKLSWRSRPQSPLFFIHRSSITFTEEKMPNFLIGWRAPARPSPGFFSALLVIFLEMPNSDWKEQLLSVMKGKQGDPLPPLCDEIRK